jgi:hypothetical protein
MTVQTNGWVPSKSPAVESGGKAKTNAKTNRTTYFDFMGSSRLCFSWAKGKPKPHAQSVDPVSLALQTGPECAVEPVSVLRLLAGLLLRPLPIGFLFPSDLVRTSHAAHQSTGTGADGRTSSGIPGDSPSNHSNRCTAGSAAD